MLRLRKKLQPRIPNHLAVLSAVLLMVSAFATSTSALEGNQASPLLPEFAQTEKAELSAAARQAKNAAAKQAVNLSLMIFKHN